MSDQWMPVLKLPVTPDAFGQLPRNPAYRYDYVDGCAVLTPRAQQYHATLDLASFHAESSAADGLTIRLLACADRAGLPNLFAWAFTQIQPYGSLSEDERLVAATATLDRAFSGGNGPWLEAASFVAADPDCNRPLAAALVTVLPGGDPRDLGSYSWPSPAPPDDVALRIGQPHLTWIFVAPVYAGTGLGTALLQATVASLRRLGYASLWSTFIAGNDRSILWHWRNGFRLQPHPSSKRS